MAVRMGFLVHELRNALSCVYAAHYMLKRTTGRSSEILERNLRSMRVMLDRASLEIRLHKEAPPRPAALPLREAVREAALTAGEEARRKGLTLSLRVDPRLTALADGAFVGSALTNLLQNAIKFTAPGGTVRVRGFAKGGAALLEVEDQCGGLPGGRVSELFKPFTQLGEDRSGLGLGLALSRRAVARSGGTLTARDLPGKGCVFTIALPAADPDVTSSS